MFKINEKNSNILFLAMYGLFLISILLSVYFNLIFSILIFHFGSAVYGFVSKNPLKSYLFGFFIYLTFIFANIIEPFFLSVDFDFSVLPYFVYSLFWGLPGYFTAQKNSGKYVLFVLCASIFVLIGIFLFLRTW